MTGFPFVKIGPITWFGDPKDLAWWSDRPLANPKALFVPEAEIRWKVRPHADLVSARVGPQGLERDVVLKWRRLGGRRLLKSLVRPSVASREFLTGRESLKRGLSLPKPILWGEHRAWGLLIEEYLVMERIEACVNLVEALRREGQDPLKRREVLSATRQAISHLHEAGVYHGDLNSSNILLRADGTAMVIDLASARLYDELPDQKRKKDLQRFEASLLPHVTREDMGEFLGGDWTP